MKKIIKILLVCIPFIVQGQTDSTQTDTIQNTDGYITPVFEVGCSSCYSPINIENYCHQTMKKTIKLYDLRGRIFPNESKIPVGTIYIKTGIMMDFNRKEYPFIIKLVKMNQ
tara:strand:+ start:664 stop:999 length:336 start_codon:yes stop_codon:yes gene_type:complete